MGLYFFYLFFLICYLKLHVCVCVRLLNNVIFSIMFLPVCKHNICFFDEDSTFDKIIDIYTVPRVVAFTLFIIRFLLLFLLLFLLFYTISFPFATPFLIFYLFIFCLSFCLFSTVFLVF